MENFILSNPTRLIFGKGQLDNRLKKELPVDARILLVYGTGSIKRNGIYGRVTGLLEGFEVIEFSGIEANPDFDTLMKAVVVGREQRVDFVLAVGGGSVLDGAKFICGAIPFEGKDPWQIVTGEAKVNTALPLGTILTLPGTGSEMNAFAVISRRATGQKESFGGRHFAPRFSILDPEFTYSLKPLQLANGIVDAFIHVLEQYITYPVGAVVQDRMAEALLLTLKEEGPKAITGASVYENRAAIMYASTLALNGMVGAGVPQDWATHAIGHELTVVRGITHGTTLAIVMPHLWRNRFEGKRDKLAQYGRRVWDLQGPDNEVAQQAIALTEDFFEQMGIVPKASAHGLTREDVQQVVTKFRIEKVLPLGDREDVDAHVVEQVLEASFE